MHLAHYERLKPQSNAIDSRSYKWWAPALGTGKKGAGGEAAITNFA